MYHSSDCIMPPRVISGNFYDQRFPVERLLLFQNTAETGGTYWLGPDHNNPPAEFILDLCKQEEIKTLRLVNTHNFESLDRATKEFRVSTRDNLSGPDMQSMFDDDLIYKVLCLKSTSIKLYTSSS